MLPHHQLIRVRETASGDAKKLSTTSCSLAKSDALLSPAAGFFNRFTAKRVRNTSWHHSAESGQNERYSFTYVFRHNVRRPEVDQLIIPTVNTLADVHTAEKNINSLEKLGKQGQFIADTGGYVDDGGSKQKWNQGVPYKTFYSPFCLQELEMLSWNINNFKVMPAVLGYSEQALPGGGGYGSIDGVPAAVQAALNVDQFGTSLQATSGEVRTINPGDAVPVNQLMEDHIATQGGSLTTSFKMFTNYPYIAKQATAQNGVPNGDTDMGSVFRQLNARINAVDSKEDYGRYKAQLGVSTATFTFVNTGDSAMIVDMVVHRAKEDTQMLKLDPGIWNTLRGRVGVNIGSDIHPEIVQTYGKNYLDYHQRNEDRLMTTYQRQATDVDIDPRVKFLPTSYRTPVRAQQKKIRNVNTAANNDNALGDMQVTQPDTPGFVDIKREHVIVPPNCRKTISITMPAKQYDPATLNYNCVLNELGYAVTFGVTGKTTRQVLPAKVDEDKGVLGARFMGRQAAATSFHIYGHEHQVVYPCALVEKADYESNNARLPPLSDPHGLLADAVYRDVGDRDGSASRYEIKSTDAQSRGTPASTQTQVSKKRKYEITQQNEANKKSALDWAIDIYQKFQDFSWTNTMALLDAKVAEVCNEVKSSIDFLNQHIDNITYAEQVVRLLISYVNAAAVQAAGISNFIVEPAANESLVASTGKVTLDAIDQFMCQRTTQAQPAKTIQEVLDLTPKHDDLRRLDELPVIHIIGNAGISGLSNRDEGIIEKAFGLTLLLKPDVDQIYSQDLFNFIDEEGDEILSLPDNGSMLYYLTPQGGWTRGVHWDYAQEAPSGGVNPVVTLNTGTNIVYSNVTSPTTLLSAAISFFINNAFYMDSAQTTRVTANTLAQKIQDAISSANSIQNVNVTFFDAQSTPSEYSGIFVKNTNWSVTFA